MTSPVLSEEKTSFVPFAKSETKLNLLRAFAGESQARNRYTFAAERARKEGYAILSNIFQCTADQEKEHAQIFYDALRKNHCEEKLEIKASYPVGGEGSLIDELKNAYHHEFSEFQKIYPDFAKKADEESYPEIPSLFRMIASIEQCHGERFTLFCKLMEQDQLFRDNEEIVWVCLNCGYRFFGTDAPTVCPVCKHNQGYYTRKALEPYDC